MARPCPCHPLRSPRAAAIQDAAWVGGGGSFSVTSSSQDTPTQQRVENPRKDPPYSLAGFAKWCPTLILEGNKPFKLEPFQRTILKDYFAGVQETLVMLPKKNGKSTLFAALAIFHLLYTEDAECIIAASSRDQARILFKQAAKLIKRSGLEQPKGKNPVEGCLEVKSGYGMIWPAGG